MLFSIQIVTNIRCFLLALSILIGVLGNVAVSWANKDIEIVTHLSVSAIHKHISNNSLKAIFGMRLRTWSDGSTIKVFVLSDDDPLHQHFSKEKLNIFPYQLRSAWDRLVFSGMGQSPIKVSSKEEMLEKVAGTPGAIGYIWRDYVDDTISILQLQ